jgi:hypothetical protein
MGDGRNFVNGAKTGPLPPPGGQIAKSLSSPSRKNILIFRNRKSVYRLAPSCSDRGALAIVTDVEQDAVDADALLTNGA